MKDYIRRYQCLYCGVKFESESVGRPACPSCGMGCDQMPRSNSWLVDRPKLKLTNPYIETKKSIDGGEIKYVCIDVLNKGVVGSTNCKIKIDGQFISLSDKEYRPIRFLDIKPYELVTVCLFRVHSNVDVRVYNKISLEFGQVHDLYLRLLCNENLDKKIWHLELDLTSWDNYNLRFKTRRDVLKKKCFGGRI